MRQRLVSGLWILLGFAPLCLAWFVRNLSAFGSILAPGGSRALWLTAYNDLFHYPAAELTWQRFLAAGGSSILSARWTALLWNAQNLIFVLGLVFLAPMVIWGWLVLRRQPGLTLAAAYLSILFLVMTLIFPFQGSRGGFLHSSAALIPVAVICAAIGLERLVTMLAKWRSRSFGYAELVFFYGFVALSAMTTFLIFQNRVIGGNVDHPVWSQMDAAYSQILDWMRNDAISNPRVMVNNPPCFVYRTGWDAVAVPDGETSTVLAVAERYRVEYLVLDSNSPAGLLGLFMGEETNPRIVLLQTIQVEHGIYRVYAIH